MQSVDVSLRDGQVFVTTIHGSFGGEPCIAAGPVLTLQIADSPEHIGRAIFSALDKSTQSFPSPENKEQWKKVTEPLFAAAKVKNWSAYAKRASSVRIDRFGRELKLSPARRDKSNAFFPVAERERLLSVPTEGELGQLAVEELRYALERDGVS
jgi:hypothetical protein